MTTHEVTERWTINVCSECGRIEGEQPQAGCCPGCGRQSEPIPIEVVPASSLQEVERERDELREALLPFAMVADQVEPGEDEERDLRAHGLDPADGIPTLPVDAPTVADYRRAAALSNPKEEQ